VVLSLACKPAEDLPSPPIDSIGESGDPFDSNGGTSAYDDPTDDTNPLDDTAGTGGGSSCNPNAAEFVCRGFAVGVYVGPDGTETIHPSGGTEVPHVCVDPAVTTDTDPGHTYQDIRMCAPWHGNELLDCENPEDAGEEVLCNDLIERCQAQCEADTVLPEEVSGHTLDRVECIITFSNEIGYGRPPYNPDCNSSEQLRVDHRFPRNHDAPGEDYKPCSLVSCSTAECSDYDPIGGVGLTQGLRESHAVIHRGLLDRIEANPLALWECDPGRYAETLPPATDTTDGTTPASWRFEDLAPGGLLYELGLRNGDSNAHVWAYDPSTGAAISDVHELDSVEGLAAAYSVLFDEPHLIIEVERPRASNAPWHTLRVSVEDCSIDLDEDGRPDAVRCSDP